MLHIRLCHNDLSCNNIFLADDLLELSKITFYVIYETGTSIMDLSVKVSF